MEKSNYTQRVDECLERVATWLESFDPDEVDYSTTDGVVSLQFPDGVRYVLNRQSAASQVWFAAGAKSAPSSTLTAVIIGALVSTLATRRSTSIVCPSALGV